MLQSVATYGCFHPCFNYDCNILYAATLYLTMFVFQTDFLSFALMNVEFLVSRIKGHAYGLQNALWIMKGGILRVRALYKFKN